MAREESSPRTRNANEAPSTATTQRRAAAPPGGLRLCLCRSAHAHVRHVRTCAHVCARAGLPRPLDTRCAHHIALAHRGCWIWTRATSTHTWTGPCQRWSCFTRRCVANVCVFEPYSPRTCVCAATRVAPGQGRGKEGGTGFGGTDGTGSAYLVIVRHSQRAR